MPNSIAVSYAGDTPTSSCVPGTECTSSDDNVCVCPQRIPPFGLNPSQVPQFILITHDDWVINESVAELSSLVLDMKNSNGCPVPITWFSVASTSSCKLVRERWALGDEIAVHGAEHEWLDYTTDESVIKDQIEWARTTLVDRCGIRKCDKHNFHFGLFKKQL